MLFRRSHALTLQLACAVVASVGIVGIGPVWASPRTYVAEGTLRYVDSGLAGTFAIGDPFTLVYQFESSTTDSNADPAHGWYEDAILSATATVDSYVATFGGSSSRLTVDNDTGTADRYRVDLLGTMSGATVGGWELAPLQTPILQLRDSTETALSSDAIPTAPPDPADFPGAGTFLALAFVDPGDPASQAFIEADVTSLTPEPSSLTLLALMFASALRLRRAHDV